MAKENEIIVLDIDKAEVARRLKAIKAKRAGAYKYKRIEFLLGGNLEGSHSWGRVRTDGKSTTITVKQLHKGGLSPMDEYEVKTNDFKDTVKIVSRLIDSDLIIYFENERDAYSLGKTLITIDKWPGIPHFVEIEAPSMKAAKEAYNRLKIKGKLIGNMPIHNIYKKYGLDFKKVMSKNKGKLKILTNR